MLEMLLFLKTLPGCNADPKFIPLEEKKHLNGIVAFKYVV